MQFASFDDDVGEIEQMYLKWVEHAFTSHNHLLRLFFDWQRADQGSDFFGGLPLGELAQTLLTSPNARVDDLQKV